jgi:SAM-dependent methyltransferase
MEAVLDFPYESIDFVYIDGSHEFDYIMCDIIEWGRRVKKGGIISGHDYHNARWSAVERAVNIYAQEHQIDKINLCDETAPSWWFERL